MSIEHDTLQYTRSLDNVPRWEPVCPLCGVRMSRNGSLETELGGYQMHQSCYTKEVNDFCEWADLGTDFGEWLSDSISRRIEELERESELRRRQGDNVEYYYSFN